MKLYDRRLARHALAAIIGGAVIVWLIASFVAWRMPWYPTTKMGRFMFLDMTALAALIVFCALRARPATPQEQEAA